MKQWKKGKNEIPLENYMKRHISTADRIHLIFWFLF